MPVFYLILMAIPGLLEYPIWAVMKNNNIFENLQRKPAVNKIRTISQPYLHNLCYIISYKFIKIKNAYLCYESPY